MRLKRLRVIAQRLAKEDVEGISENVEPGVRIAKDNYHDEHSCALLATGECPVLDLDKSELIGLKNVPSASRETDKNYCRYLAEKMMSNDKNDAWALRHNPCDGRHRDCIATILKSKDIEVKMDIGWQY